MDTGPHRPDDVSDLERRLAACVPAAAGLDADAMLFAAGRASARPGRSRFAWPALSAALAALAAVLGVRLTLERAEQFALADRLRQSAPHEAPAPPPAVAPEPPTADQPPPNSLLAARRALEQGLDAWPASAVSHVEPEDPRPQGPPVLRVGRPDDLPDL